MTRTNSPPPRQIGLCRESDATAHHTTQTNIFEIVRTTGKARRLNQSEVHARYLGLDIEAKLQSKAYFILHASHLTRSSQETINRINDPSQCTQLVAFAVRKLQADAGSLGGSFPDGYYATLARAIIEEAISYTPANPDQGVDLAGKTFGLEVGEKPETLPAYQIYDAIARVNDDNGYDKVQHFTRSAYLQYNYGKTATDATQYGKEIRDEIKSWYEGGQGFDSKDMLANNRGQEFGEQLYAKYHPIRNYLRNLD
ncbi:MAG: hypothetical protein ABI453_09775 [Isosphaeraceae bacterium]